MTISKNTNIIQREFTIVGLMSNDIITTFRAPQYSDFRKFDKWAALVVRILNRYKPLYWNINKKKNDKPNNSNDSNKVAPINSK